MGKKPNKPKVGIHPRTGRIPTVRKRRSEIHSETPQAGSGCCYRGGGISGRFAHHQSRYRQGREHNYGVRV